jgi:DNA-binding MarR family transcriptional regulator
MKQRLTVSPDKLKLSIVTTLFDLDARLVQAAGELRSALRPLTRRLRSDPVRGDLTLSELSLLARLEREGAMTPAELARREQVRPQSVVVPLARLEAHGLVRKTQDASDGRKLTLSLTRAGSARVGDARAERTRQLARAIAQALTPAEQDVLIRAIPLLDRVSQAL